MPQFLSSELDLGLMRDTVIRLSPTEKEVSWHTSKLRNEIHESIALLSAES
jgi:hypothetical protein